MDWSEMVAEIESQDFAIRLNVASTRRVFFAVLKAEPAFSGLVQLLREEPELETKVLRRIATLAAIDFDLAYEHPYDSALAAYAWALASQAPESALIAAQLLIGTRQTCWAHEIAQLILQEVPASTVDPRTLSLTTSEPVFGRRQPHASFTTKGVLETLIVWPVLSRKPRVGYLARMHSKKADTPHAFARLLLQGQGLRFRNKLPQNLLYIVSVPHPTETTVEWSR